MEKNKQGKSQQNIFALLLIALAVGLFLMANDESKSLDSSANQLPKIPVNKEYTERARGHLLMTADEVKLRELKHSNDVLEKAPSLSQTAEQRAYHGEGFDLSSESTARDLAKDLNRDNVQNAAVPETPDQLIQSEIFNQQQLADYSAAYKEEYARQFIENARRAGWEVVLDEDFRVISTRRIRNPAHSSPIISPSNSGFGSAR